MADKESLISGPGEQTSQVSIRGGALVVTVQGLDRSQVIKVAEAKSTLDRDRKMLAWGTVDPELTYQDVERWQKQRGAAGEIEDISHEIARLSGMLEGAGKAYFQEVSEEN